MNMSLNFSQYPRIGRPPGPGRKSDVSAKRMEAIAVFTLEYFETAGRAPSTEEISKAFGYSVKSIRRAWKALVDAGTIPEHIAQCRTKQNLERVHKPGNTNHAHTGNCTPETANKIFNLIKNDIEARITFSLMQRGILRKDL